MSKIKVYYWPFLARGAALIRMLEHTGTPYEYISDRSVFTEHMSAFGAEAGQFAPPVVTDGDYAVSQSVACALYLGKKLKVCVCMPASQPFVNPITLYALQLMPPGYDEFKAVQYCIDMIDTFEGNLGKNNENGKLLKAFLEGDRFSRLMGNIERNIKVRTAHTRPLASPKVALPRARTLRAPTFSATSRAPWISSSCSTWTGATATSLTLSRQIRRCRPNICMWCDALRGRALAWPGWHSLG